MEGAVAEAQAGEPLAAAEAGRPEVLEVEADRPKVVGPEAEAGRPEVAEVEAGRPHRAPSSERGAPPCSINSYYGHKIGFLQTLSLVLNAGLMVRQGCVSASRVPLLRLTSRALGPRRQVYAHVGLSAVILSSRDPEAVAAGAGAAGNANGAAASAACDARDAELWIQVTKLLHCLT